MTVQQNFEESRLSQPAIISYCATFLKPEMLHVYRQVSGVSRFENWVVTRRREHAERFPYDKLTILKKSPFRIFRREAYRLLGKPVPLGRYEVDQLLALAKEKQAALVHIYFGTEAARALPYLRREQRAKVVSFHGVDVSDSLSDKDLKGLIECSDLFLVRSHTLADALVERGCDPARIRLSRTSVPIPDVPPIDGPLRDGRYRLLQACRFIRKKGLDTSLQALAILRRKGLDVCLDLAGDGPEKAALVALVGNLHLRDHVRFLGFLPNQALLERLPNYSLFLHPSRVTETGDREGIPNAMLEAMACGLPVVATGHSGIPEAVSDGIEGCLVAQDDPDALATAVASVLGDPELFRRMSASARHRIIEEFSSQRAIEQLCKAYDDAISLSLSRGR